MKLNDLGLLQLRFVLMEYAFLLFSVDDLDFRIDIELGFRMWARLIVESGIGFGIVTYDLCSIGMSAGLGIGELWP